MGRTAGSARRALRTPQSIMEPFSTDLLADLVRARRACLAQLRELGRRQLELIGAEEMSALLELLTTKQRTIRQLQRIEAALDPFRSQDPEKRSWRTPADRERCAAEMAAGDALLSEIVKQEKQSEQALVLRRDETAQRLQGAHLAAQARAAYGAQPAATIGQLDIVSGQ